ncbi:MAG: ABC transporter ATP-binding protein [Desulfohalobiaceae bacterium]|nr:ABC transporter ATP-binding protein [Desulfohalobiaceae bacterium]
MAKNQIRIENITKTYASGRRQVQALSKVSLVLPAGRRLILLGKSGSGKTTLLNCLAGFERVDRGRIECFGTDFQALSAKKLSVFHRRDMGFLFQSGNLLSKSTVFENIAFPLRLNDFHGKRLNQRVAELLGHIGLPGFEAAMPFELSSGEAQRVAFARAVAHSPRLLLADEPTASLDSETGQSLVELMSQICRKQGSTMIIASHDPSIIRFAEISLKLRDGRVVDRELLSSFEKGEGNAEA